MLEAVLASADIEAVEALACKGFDDRGRVTRGDPVLVECDLEQSVATIRCSSGAAIWKDAAPPHLVDVAVFCDSDDTHTASISYFAYVRLERR